MQKVELLYLSQEDIMGLDIGWEEIIKRVELALIEQADKTIENPPKRGVHSRGNAFIHEMPVYLKQMDACGIKWVSGYPDNREKGLPQILGLQIMNCPETGVPLCVMDCRWITGVRTAAVTAITVRHCAKKNAKGVGIIGAGVQGKMHLRAIKHVMPSLEVCRVYDIYLEAAQRYAESLAEELNMKVIPCASVEETMKDVEIVFTATQKVEKPFIPAKAFRPGMLGGGLEAGRAWPGELLHGVNKVITDDLGQTSQYASTGAFEGGLPDFYGELGEIVKGKPGRESDEERILAFNIGIACEDISLGQYVYEVAKARGAGIMLPLMEKEF